MTNITFSASTKKLLLFEDLSSCDFFVFADCPNELCVRHECGYLNLSTEWNSDDDCDGRAVYLVDVKIEVTKIHC